MILEFACSNHKSIKNKVIFSTISGSDQTYSEELIDYSNNKILRTTAIYGSNGSGKSNFLEAILYMQNLVINSINYQPGTELSDFSHKLALENSESTYSIQFVKDDIRYAYGFSVEKRNIKEEYLYYFPKGRQVKIFERDNMEVIPGSRYKKDFELSLSALKENRLFLSCVANYSRIKEIEIAFIFFKDDIIYYNPTANNWIEYSINLIQKDEDVKDKFINMLRALGTGIKDIRAKLEKKQFLKDELPTDMPDALKNFLVDQEANLIEAKVIYDGFETDLMNEESNGIKKLFEVICPIIDILNKGKVLICDEIEIGLHESVVYEIIKFFKLNKETNAQLIFTTHDTSLLDSKLFRRDQIWFTQLDNERSTDLYSLAEIKNVRKTENLAKGYIEGKYGAIPMLNRSFAFVDKDEKEVTI